MKKKICLLLVLSILILCGCRNAGPAGEITSTPTTYQTDSVNEETGPVFTDPEQDSNHTESVSQTEGSDETKPDPTKRSLPRPNPSKRSQKKPSLLQQHPRKQSQRKRKLQ